MPTFGPSRIGGGSGERTRSGRLGPAGSESAAQSKQSKKAAWKLLPDVWALIKPHRTILAVGFLLMLINRLAGLVAPGSLKYLFDNVIGKHQAWLLEPLVGIVLGATIIQGLTSYSLTQLLSKSSQRMITELRVKVQAHIGRLPVAYYDANKKVFGI
jgi:ABC-type bacteriocin/lantibiotic exporter with double-glycine peptidase domain